MAVSVALDGDAGTMQLHDGIPVQHVERSRLGPGRAVGDVTGGEEQMRGRPVLAQHRQGSCEDRPHAVVESERDAAHGGGAKQRLEGHDR